MPGELWPCAICGASPAKQDRAKAADDLYEALEYAYPFVRYCQHEHMGDREGNESEKSIAVEKIVAAMLKANPAMAQYTPENDAQTTLREHKKGAAEARGEQPNAK